MTWPLLADELDHWAHAGIVAAFWWRDDDAVSDTEQLDDLLSCASNVPIALSVIPDLADRSLVEKLARQHSATVLQHGWRHTNHATEASSNSEYPAGRNPHEVAREFSVGYRLLKDLFGPQSLPVFVPPWHGFDASYLTLLAQAGIKAISRRGPRDCAVVSGLAVSNVHCVPIQWGEPPSFGSDEEYLGSIIEHLAGRRRGHYDAGEPTGVLTHHLVQNARSYAFMAKLVAIISEHPAAKWLDARDVFNVQRFGPSNPNEI